MIRDQIIKRLCRELCDALNDVHLYTSYDDQRALARCEKSIQRAASCLLEIQVTGAAPARHHPAPEAPADENPSSAGAPSWLFDRSIEVTQEWRDSELPEQIALCESAEAYFDAGYILSGIEVTYPDARPDLRLNADTVRAMTDDEFIDALEVRASEDMRQPWATECD